MRRRAFAGALGLTLCGWAAAAPAAGPVPWPSVRLIDGTERSPEHWRGQETLVVFWATWCAYCKRHNDRLDRLAHLPAARPMPRLLTVCIDGDLATVTRHVHAQGWRFPVALDEGRLRPLFTERRIVPMSVLVGRDGLVRQRIPGEMAEEDLRELLFGRGA